MNERSYIDKDEILKYLNEEEIFELVFGFKPKPGLYVTSPFREDKNPGCWFDYNHRGELIFYDFGTTMYYKHINMRYINCFNAVQVYFNLPNFYKVLEFIKTILINNRNVQLSPKNYKKRREERAKKSPIQITIDQRQFQEVDKEYWSKYGISSENLNEDMVYAIKGYSIIKNRRLLENNVITPAYAYTGFEEGRKKIYFPYRNKKRFLSNCSKSDIGEIESLPIYGKTLIISKSYKDCRVLRNENYNSIWFQNEGCVPNEEIIITLCERFEKLIVFYDNDRAGIEASIKVRDEINSYYPKKATNLYLPEDLLSKNISDPADMYCISGREELQKFLKTYITR